MDALFPSFVKKEHGLPALAVQAVVDVGDVGPQRLREILDNLRDGYTALDLVEPIRWERHRYGRKAEARVVAMPP